MKPMKNIASIVVLLLSAFAWAGTIPKAADYAINVHVSRSYIGEHGEQRLRVIIDGTKYELVGGSRPYLLLALGDYRAKLVKDEHHGTYDSLQVYEFLFSDQKTRKFQVVAQME